MEAVLWMVLVPSGAKELSQGTVIARLDGEANTRGRARKRENDFSIGNGTAG